MKAHALSLAAIGEIGEGLLACTFPADRFHHREHLLATAYLIHRKPELDLRIDLPEIIRRYNVANGGANTDDAGYHHSITMFFLDQVERFLADRSHRPFPDICAELLGSPLADKDFILAFYSRETLFSREARLCWVEPDLLSETGAI